MAAAKGDDLVQLDGYRAIGLKWVLTLMQIESSAAVLSTSNFARPSRVTATGGNAVGDGDLILWLCNT